MEVDTNHIAYTFQNQPYIDTMYVRDMFRGEEIINVPDRVTKLVIPGCVRYIDYFLVNRIPWNNIEVILMNGVHPPQIEIPDFIKQTTCLSIPKGSINHYTEHPCFKDFLHIEEYRVSIYSEEEREENRKDWYANEVTSQWPYPSEVDYLSISEYCELIGLDLRKAYFDDSRFSMYVPSVDDLHKVTEFRLGEYCTHQGCSFTSGYERYLVLNAKNLEYTETLIVHDHYECPFDRIE